MVRGLEIGIRVWINRKTMFHRLEIGLDNGVMSWSYG